MIRKKHVLTTIIVFSVLFVSNCASVKILDQNGRAAKGFMYYQAKPYIVIENTEKGKIIKLISIPDIRNPRYIKYKSGWGKVDFSFKLDNGMLVEFGQQPSTYIPETIAAGGGVATGVGAFATGIAALTTAMKAGAVEDDKITMEFKVLTDAANKIDRDIIPVIDKYIENNKNSVLTEILKELSNIRTNLQQSATFKIDKSAKDILAEIEKGKRDTLIFVKTSIIPEIEKVLEKLNKSMRGLAELNQQELHFLINTTIIKVDDILDTLKIFSQITVPLQIFEIIEENNKIKFRQINIENM